MLVTRESELFAALNCLSSKFHNDYSIRYDILYLTPSNVIRKRKTERVLRGTDETFCTLAY